MMSALAVVALLLVVVLAVIGGLLMGLRAAHDQNEMARGLILAMQSEGSFRKSLDSLTSELAATRGTVAKQGEVLEQLDKGMGVLSKLLMRGEKLTTYPGHEQTGPGMNAETGDGLRIPPRRQPDVLGGKST